MPTENDYRKSHKSTSYFEQEKNIFVCSSGRWNVIDTGTCFGDPNGYGPTMTLKKGGTIGIFFGTPLALTQAQSVCNHPSPSGVQNDWTHTLPCADGLGTILIIISEYLSNSKAKISFVPNPKHSS